MNPGARPLPDPARVNLKSLCEETLAVVSPVLAVFGYLALTMILNTRFGRNLAWEAQAGAIVLIIGGTGAYLLRKKQQMLAIHLLVWSAFGASILAMAALPEPMIMYLLVLPVILANSLLRRRLVLVSTLAALVVVLVIAPLLMSALTVADQVLVTAVLVVVSITAWMASRNLRTTFDWMSRAYEEATRQESLLRDAGAELKRALKGMDEATHRLDRANLALAHERNNADEARRIKQQFAQTISHELRTPLNLVMSFTDLMIETPDIYGGPLPPAYLRDLTVIQRNAQHLHQLVNDVLELSQIEATQMGMQMTRTDPAYLVNDALGMVCQLAVARRLTITTNIEPDLPLLNVDPTRIRQVLVNLLNNAIKFTDHGGMHVTVHRDPSHERVIFTVTDTGPGISAHDIPRLFHEFGQLDSSTRRKHAGTGLGLVICKRFVEMHQGRIWVDSHPGIGSTFGFELPVQLDERQPVTDPQTARRPYSGTRVALVLTQSAFASNLLARHLTDWRIVTADSLEAACIAARQHLPELVIADTVRQPMSADALQSFLREAQLEHSVAIACPLPGEDLVRRQMDAHAYLTKPVTRDTLLHAISKASQHGRRVLLIDDDEGFSWLIRRFLESAGAGYRLTSARTGAEGLMLFKQLKPDVVVLDVQLPDMSGTQIAKSIRALAEHTNTPLVVVSGQEFSPIFERVDASLAVAKAQGFSATELLRMVGGVVGKPSVEQQRLS
jgi:signal transduction histidine kinase/CheY-like chemotaxis protein